ncbi:MAG TPA: YciI family protein [Gammaproteobacteria bacterium]|nr:YciI family protein [Gammaproteobacteria bacterium]
MKFMMLMIPAVYQSGNELPPDFAPDMEKIEQMTRFNEEMGKALKILDMNGLHPRARGARVAFSGGEASVTDGPFIESKEVLGGYWLIEADSREEVVAWTQKCPADEGDVIEIRQVFAEEDFEQA